MAFNLLVNNILDILIPISIKTDFGMAKYGM
jgi:hypothetical protein